ncbi:MAG: DNA-binding response regulator [Bacteroidetes bacterium]|nr:MAG: DNA-binding response regulator [Bacteroidota bacterium]
MANVLIAEHENGFAESFRKCIPLMGHKLIDVKDNAEGVLRTAIATKPDILLMEVGLKGSMDGIKVAERLRESGWEIPIIFITNQDDSETFARAKDVKAFAYIVKPFIEQDLCRTMELSLQLHRHFNEQVDILLPPNTQNVLSPNIFFIKSGDKLEKINVFDIGYVEFEHRHVVIHTAHHKYVLRITLRDFSNKLPIDTFVQVHRQYLVNINHIQYINTKSNEVHILGKIIDIGKTYKEPLMKSLNILS